MIGVLHHAAGLSIWDALRYLSFVLWAILVGFTIGILYLYRQASKLHTHARGILANHVRLVSITFGIAITECCAQNLQRLGTGFSWYIVINLLLFSLGIVALWLILIFENRRVLVAVTLEDRDPDKDP
jgi:hypothetical protein